MSSEISSPAPIPTPAAPARTLSTQLRAVLAIVQADPELERLVMPHISLETETIRWEKIFLVTYCSGYKAAITWCFNLWTDRYRPRVNSFDEALNLDDRFKRAMLQAIGIRWGLID
jgi:hypothetical protein